MTLYEIQELLKRYDEGLSTGEDLAADNNRALRWAARSGHNDVALALAEAQFNRELRIRGMEGRYTANTVASQRAYMFPGV